MSPSCFFTTALLLCAAALPAAVYEVDKTRGNDGNPGTNAQPLASIAAAQAKLAQPGDVMLIHAGRYFVHNWEVNVAGAVGNPITYRAALGETVIIDFGLRVSGAWRDDGGGLWSAPFSGDTGRVVIDGKELVLAATGTTPTAGSFQVASGRLKVFPPAGVRAPATADVVILNPTNPPSPEDCSLHITANHIALEHLIFQGGSYGIYAGNWQAPKNRYSDLTISDCEIRFMTVYGLCLRGWENCTMSRTSVHGVNQLNWPRGSSDTWGHAIIGWNATNVTIQDCQVFATHGEGIGPFLGCRDWRILRNTVYDNYSVSIYIDTDENDAAMVVDRNLVYITGAIGDPTDRRNCPDGIRVSNEGALSWYAPNQDRTPIVSNVTITNNIVLDSGTDGGITSFEYEAVGFALDRSLIAGNTVVRSHGGTAGIWIQAATGTTVADNLVYPAKVYLPNNGVTSVSNLFTNTIPFTVGTGTNPTNYRPAMGSPAIGGGTALTALTTDFFGAARSTPPDIGACQYVSGTTMVAPAITTQPTNASVSAGATATFSVVASGTPVPTYQWKKNGVNLTGATSTSYTTPATVIGDNGAVFTVVVTNSPGTATSTTATLTVNPIGGTAPSTPSSPTVTGDGTATPTLSGVTSPGAVIHIFIDGIEVGTTTAAGDGSWSYTVTGVAAGTHTITVTASNTGGTSAPSAPITVTVAAPGGTNGGSSSDGGNKKGCGIGGLMASVLLASMLLMLRTTVGALRSTGKN